MPDSERMDAIIKRENLIRQNKELKADQADWRKAVGLIAAAIQVDSLAPSPIVRAILEMRVENEALKQAITAAQEALNIPTNKKPR